MVFDRKGQTAVETLLLISVLVVAIVAASWILTGDAGGTGITNALSEFGDWRGDRLCRSRKRTLGE